MVDNDINELVVQLVDYNIGKWEVEGEEQERMPEPTEAEGPPIRKLFVGNISARTTYTDLRRLFKNYGKVMDAHITRDKYTQSKKNYGFVTFKNPEDAKRVLKLKYGELRLHLRNLYVEPANSCHQPVELSDGTILWKTRKGPAQRQPQPQSSTAISGDDKDPEVVDNSRLSSEVDQDTNEEDSTMDDGECKIHMLNNDCLIHIFSFLNKLERIKIERVCKRWQSVCLDMWLSQKHLDFAHLFPSPSKCFLDVFILESFLKRCGNNLQSLDLSNRPHDLTAKAPSIVAAHCSRLRNLNLGGLPLTPHGLICLSRVSEELRVLNLDRCSGATDKDLQNLFMKCPNLESVTLSNNNTLTGKCLFGLTHGRVKHLVLDECNNFRSKSLMSGLQGLKHLLHLSMNSCINLTSSDVSGIIGAQPKLQSLSIARYFPLFNSTALKPLGSLQDLTSLNLQLNPAVNDHIIQVITTNCQKIEVLNLTGCSVHSWETLSLTNAGLKCLANLPNLVDLSMSYLANVTDEALEAVARRGKLRILVCRGCPTFTDVGCTSIIASCNELELFDFSGCDLVTNATVRAALDSVKLRTNNIKLKLVVGATCIYEDQNMEKNSLLDVDFKDLCIAHLRPDFVDDIYFPNSDTEEEDENMVDDLCDWEWECHSLFYGDDFEYCDEFFDEANEVFGCL